MFRLLLISLLIINISCGKIQELDQDDSIPEKYSTDLQKKYLAKNLLEANNKISRNILLIDRLTIFLNQNLPTKNDNNITKVQNTIQKLNSIKNNLNLILKYSKQMDYNISYSYILTFEDKNNIVKINQIMNNSDINKTYYIGIEVADIYANNAEYQSNIELLFDTITHNTYIQTIFKNAAKL